MNMSMTIVNDRQPTLRTRLVFLLGCSALSVFIPNVSYAQQSSNPSAPLVLETITVDGKTRGDDDRNSIIATQTTSGGKIPTDVMDMPASVSVITSKEIQERNATNVEQVLNYTAGVVTTFMARMIVSIILKFVASMHICIAMGCRLKAIRGIREEPFAFERVEVLKGGSSSVFGVSDPGGSVNFTSKKPKSERFGEAYLSGGSYNHVETGLILVTTSRQTTHCHIALLASSKGRA